MTLPTVLFWWLRMGGCALPPWVMLGKPVSPRPAGRRGEHWQALRRKRWDNDSPKRGTELGSFAG